MAVHQPAPESSAAELRRLPALDLSTALLVLGNLLPVAGVLWLGWDLFLVVSLFWLENAVIGVIAAARVALAEPDRRSRLSATLFFTLHYGLFLAVQAVFIVVLLGPGSVTPMAALAATAIFAAAHLLPFGFDYVAGGGHHTASAAEEMVRPYGRVAVVHVAILIAAILADLVGAAAAGALGLSVAKTLHDLVAESSRTGRLRVEPDDSSSRLPAAGSAGTAGSTGAGGSAGAGSFLEPVLVFVGAVSGMIGGAVVGSWIGAAVGSEWVASLAAGILLCTGTIAGAMYLPAVARRRRR